MGRKSPNPNSIDPTEEPLNKVPLVVDEAPSYPEDSPIDEGIEEEQQGDLEGLDGQNSDADLADQDDLLDPMEEPDLDADDDAP